MRKKRFDAVNLRSQIEDIFNRSPEALVEQKALELFEILKRELNSGRIRAAEKRDGKWRVNEWVKKGILLGFRFGRICEYSIDKRFVFFDKNTMPLKAVGENDGVRIVPGGSAIRDGCYIGHRVTCMPPMYINIGAYVDDDTMIDSNALIGSCAQVGKRVHISAGSQIGGVLEPVGSFPVIIEDDVLVGGNCGIYEGTIVQRGAVIGAGTILTGSTPVYDLVKNEILRKGNGCPLHIPENAVVVPGARGVKDGYGAENNISIYTPVIIKYRDSKTEETTTLEDLLR